MAKSQPTKTPGRAKKPIAKAAAQKSKPLNKGGRPLKIKTPKLFDEAVDAYVATCIADEQPITWTGMALALGFYGRDSLDEYAKHEGFSDSVKRAKAIVERAYERRLHGNSPTGAIFALKNMGWKDRQDLEHDVSDKLADLLSEMGGTPQSSPLARLKSEQGGT